MTVSLCRIAHIADLHFWRVCWNPLRMLNKRFLGNLNVALRRSKEFRMEMADAHAAEVAATAPDLVLLTGDFTSTSLDEEFAMARAFVDGIIKRGLCVALVPGNHDVYTFESARKRLFEKWFHDLLPEGGFPARLELPGDVSLVLVDTVRPNLLSARGAVTPETLTRLRSELSISPSPIVLASHYPMLYETEGYHSAWSHRLRGADGLRRICLESGKRILHICGHVHRFSLTQDTESPLLNYCSTGALFRDDQKRKLQGEFTEVEVMDTDWKVRRHIKDNGVWGCPPEA